MVPIVALLPKDSAYVLASTCMLLALVIHLARPKVQVVGSHREETRDVEKARDSVAHFKSIIRSTQCSYARASLVHGHDDGEGFSSIASKLEEFCRRVEARLPLDGFIVERRGTGHTLADLTERVRELLHALSDCDPDEAHCLSESHVPAVHATGWVFRFASTDLFLTTFGPCYDDSSPRWSAGVPSTFVLFQPYESFLRHGIDCLSPLTIWGAPESSRDKIRAKFKRAGRPYNTMNGATSPHAYEVVRPLHLGEALVEWWQSSGQSQCPQQASRDGGGGDGGHGYSGKGVHSKELSDKQQWVRRRPATASGIHPELACSGSMGIPTFETSPK